MSFNKNKLGFPKRAMARGRRRAAREHCHWPQAGASRLARPGSRRRRPGGGGGVKKRSHTDHKTHVYVPNSGGAAAIKVYPALHTDHSGQCIHSVPRPPATYAQQEKYFEQETSTVYFNTRITAPRRLDQRTRFLCNPPLRTLHRPSNGTQTKLLYTDTDHTTLMDRRLRHHLEHSQLALARMLRMVLEARVHCRSVLSDSEPDLVSRG